MSLTSDVHEFAFYTPVVSELIIRQAHGNIHEITDPELVHRLIIVLRLEQGAHFVLFDRNYSMRVVLLGIRSKKSFTIEILSSTKNPVLTPLITWGLPVLKREAFEEALYSLCELGVTAIQPLTTRKTVRSWGDEKELQRAQKILIAAAEQAKQFVVPVLLPVLSLESWLNKLDIHSNCHLFFDASGDPLSEVLPKLSKNSYSELIMLSGPEGDLTTAEKEDLKQHNFIFSKLTPTILRAQQAVTVGLGVVRSLYS